MKTRPANSIDCEELKQIYAQSGLIFQMPQLDSPLIEAAEVVTDDNGKIMFGAIAQRTLEIYLIAPYGQFHPMVKMEGIRLLHGSIRDTIAIKGYSEGFAFIPPTIEHPYGRHLRKWFGWEKCWPAYRIIDWKGAPKSAERC